MNKKQFIGIGFLLAGIILVIFAFYQKGRLSSAQSSIDKGTAINKSLFRDNPVGEIGNMVTGSMQNKVDMYNNQILWCLVGGIALVGIGAGLALFGRQKG